MFKPEKYLEFEQEIGCITKGLKHEFLSEDTDKNKRFQNRQDFLRDEFCKYINKNFSTKKILKNIFLDKQFHFPEVDLFDVNCIHVDSKTFQISMQN
jgi:hypothetical protein